MVKGQPNSLKLSQKGLVQESVVGAFKEPRALGVKIVVLERSLDNVILGAMSTTKAGGTSVADESLLEEASRYSFMSLILFLALGVGFLLLLLSLRGIRRWWLLVKALRRSIGRLLRLERQSLTR